MVQHTPLHLASQFGYFTIVTELIRCIQERYSGKLSLPILNARNTIQRTALIWAAMQGHSTVVDVLLRAGADRDAIDSHGLTADSAALKYGNAETREVLTQAKVWAG